jgi:NIPSNAP
MDTAKIKQVDTTTTEPSLQVCSPIVELRQYTLYSGQRDREIALFEHSFIETQEAVGIAVIGQFRDVVDPDRFVWLRGFPDMDKRLAALQAFYGGPVWRTHHDEVDEMIIDSDNVLLLRPARPASGFLLDPRDRPPPGAEEGPLGLAMATILSFDVRFVPSKQAVMPEEDGEGDNFFTT